jgi:hypothetical protein
MLSYAGALYKLNQTSRQKVAVGKKSTAEAVIKQSGCKPVNKLIYNRLKKH